MSKTVRSSTKLLSLFTGTTTPFIFSKACKDLTLAAASGKTSDVTRTIELGAEVDTTVNGYTPLMRAANWGHVDTLAALIAEGGDMFATDRQGRTALDWSRIARRDKAARVLERAMENEIRYRRYSMIPFVQIHQRSTAVRVATAF